MNDERVWDKQSIVTTALIVASAVAYCSWPLGFWLNPGAEKHGLASELGALGQPYDWVFIWGDIFSGMLLMTACLVLLKMYHLHAWAKVCLLALAVYGLCGALDAALPLNCLPSEQVCGPVLHNPELILHGGVDLLGSGALIMTLVAAWFYIRQHHAWWRRWIYSIGGGGVLFALASGYLYIFHDAGFWAQRYYLTLSCIWVATIPFVLRSRRATIGELNNVNIKSAVRDLAR